MVHGRVSAAAAAARLRHEPDGRTTAGRQVLAGVRDLPGVTRVFPASSGTARWFDGPVTLFLEEGSSVRSWVTIGVDRHHPSAATVGLVGGYVRARLVERGFDFIEVRIRVALFE